MHTSERESAILDAVEAIGDSVHAATAERRERVWAALAALVTHEVTGPAVDVSTLLWAARMAVSDLVAVTLLETIGAMIDRQEQGQ